MGKLRLHIQRLAGADLPVGGIDARRVNIGDNFSWLGNRIW
jgi:hypothetical protein